MAVLLIVEDGSVVANANTFVTAAEVVSYADRRGYDFDNNDPDESARAIIRAADWMKNTSRLQYRGSLRSAVQCLPWPRDSASFYRGPDIPSTLIPQCVKDAQCELAYRTFAGTELQPDMVRGGATKKEKLDVIEVEYFEGAPAETVIQAVLGILAPVLISQNTTFPTPYQASPVDKTPYLPGEFDNPPQTYSSNPAATS